MAFIGYARVSTEDQDLHMQLKALEDAGCIKIFSDKKTGSDGNREQFKLCLDYLRPGDTLVLYRLDRLARNTMLTLSVIDDLRARGIDIVSLRDMIDIHTPNGMLITTVKAAIAELQKETTRALTKEALARARAEGRVGGRPRALTENKIKEIACLSEAKHTLATLKDTYKVSIATITRAKRHARKMGWLST